MYATSTVYIVGNSKTNSENPITTLYNAFYIGFVVEPESGLIEDVSCSSTLRTTDEFVRSLFTGKTMRLDDESLEAEIRRRYHGSSQKAIIVAYKDAAKTLAEIQKRA
jgi:hypothetical protein